MGDFTIRLSSKLVNRLAEDSEKLKKKTKKTKANTSRQNQVALDDSKTLKGKPPSFLPVTTTAQSAELNAIQSAVQQSEKVLEKLNKQEQNMLQEVTERAKSLHEREFKFPYQKKPLPCLAEKDACEACYKEFVKDPLKCLRLLTSYADCSRQARQQVSSAN
ncbi:hypothetical protein Dsin_031201 [Dipteronia sinensis]|uniref:Uncharacterized protein n=1 Tax=Dipteronia sinensis TaxID=43782 RepID=A0AAD9ZM09_9ROSI|nr:hypothetical protein Dsin_031201 [Dipteronia sinensis]